MNHDVEMMDYWQKRNMFLFSIEKQTQFTMKELLKLPSDEFNNLLFTVKGYNEKLNADHERRMKGIKNKNYL